jgi:hypothetical protein
MKHPNLSRHLFNSSPMFVSNLRTAHSGPELVNTVPQPNLAHELAQILLTDRTQLTQAPAITMLGNGLAIGFTIGLAKR